MGSKKRPPSRVESAVETALRETGGVTVTGGSGLPTVVRGAMSEAEAAASAASLISGPKRDPFEDVRDAVCPQCHNWRYDCGNAWHAAARMPMPDVQTAVGPEAIDEVLAQSPPEAPAEPVATLPSPAHPDAAASMDGARNAIRWNVGVLWSDRVERMAQTRGLTVEGFLESLLRRAWVSMPVKDRKDGP